MALKGPNPKTAARTRPPGVPPFQGYRRAALVTQGCALGLRVGPFQGRFAQRLLPGPCGPRAHTVPAPSRAQRRRQTPSGQRLRPRRGLTRQPGAQPWGSMPALTHGPERAEPEDRCAHATARSAALSGLWARAALVTQGCALVVLHKSQTPPCRLVRPERWTVGA